MPDLARGCELASIQLEGEIADRVVDDGRVVLGSTAISGSSDPEKVRQPENRSEAAIDATEEVVRIREGSCGLAGAIGGR